MARANIFAILLPAIAALPIMPVLNNETSAAQGRRLQSSSATLDFDALIDSSNDIADFPSSWESGGQDIRCVSSVPQQCSTLDWRIGSGRTRSGYTGEVPDIDTWTPRRYIYTEASHPAKAGDVFQLAFSPTEAQCAGTQKVVTLQMQYHMQCTRPGQDGMGDFRIVDDQAAIIWERHGNQGTAWNDATISFPSGTSKVVFQTTVDDWCGDVLIRQLRMTCLPRPASPTMDPVLRRIFSRIDWDADTRITAEELTRRVDVVGRESNDVCVLNQLFSQLDQANATHAADGAISISEFAARLTIVNGMQLNISSNGINLACNDDGTAETTRRQLTGASSDIHMKLTAGVLTESHALAEGICPEASSAGLSHAFEEMQTDRDDEALALTVTMLEIAMAFVLGPMAMGIVKVSDNTLLLAEAGDIVLSSSLSLYPAAIDHWHGKLTDDRGYLALRCISHLETWVPNVASRITESSVLQVVATNLDRTATMFQTIKRDVDDGIESSLSGAQLQVMYEGLHHAYSSFLDPTLATAATTHEGFLLMQLHYQLYHFHVWSVHLALGKKIMDHLSDLEENGDQLRCSIIENNSPYHSGYEVTSLVRQMTTRGQNQLTPFGEVVSSLKFSVNPFLAWDAMANGVENWADSQFVSPAGDTSNSVRLSRQAPFPEQATISEMQPYLCQDFVRKEVHHIDPCQSCGNPEGGHVFISDSSLANRYGVCIKDLQGPSALYRHNLPTNFDLPSILWDEHEARALADFDLDAASRDPSFWRDVFGDSGVACPGAAWKEFAGYQIHSLRIRSIKYRIFCPLQVKLQVPRVSNDDGGRRLKMASAVLESIDVPNLPINTLTASQLQEANVWQAVKTRAISQAKSIFQQTAAATARMQPMYLPHTEIAHAQGKTTLKDYLVVSSEGVKEFDLPPHLQQQYPNYVKPEWLSGCLGPRLPVVNVPRTGRPKLLSHPSCATPADTQAHLQSVYGPECNGDRWSLTATGKAWMAFYRVSHLESDEYEKRNGWTRRWSWQYCYTRSRVVDSFIDSCEHDGMLASVMLDKQGIRTRLMDGCTRKSTGATTDSATGFWKEL